MKKKPRLGSRLATAAGGLLAPPVMWAMSASWKRVHIGSLQGYRDMIYRTPHVCAMWHQRILMLLPENAPRGAVVMVSQSRDGEVIGRMMHKMGYRLARGSSTRGGREALYDVMDWIRAGRVAGMVADGPLGPARVVKMGSVLAARETGTTLCGVSAAASRSIQARSWDRTEIPLPFATVVYGYTEPFSVPPKASLEECEIYRKRLEDEINAIDARCEALARKIAHGG